MKILKTKLLLYFLICILTFAFFNKAFASTDFLTVPKGVRSAGMGGAYIALAEGPETVFYNYAATPKLKGFYANLEYGQFLETNYFTLAGQNLFDYSPLRWGYIYAFSDNIPYTFLNELGYPEATGTSFGYSTHTGYLSHNTNWLDFELGLGLEAHLEALATQNANTISLGGSLQRSIDLAGDMLTCAITFKNFLSTNTTWSTGTKDTIPYNIIYGISYKTKDNKFNLNLDFSTETARLYNWNLITDYYAGMEYWWHGTLTNKYGSAIRAGFNKTNFAFGIGLNIDGLIFNCAYLLPQKSYLDANFRFSIGWSAHPFEVEIQKKSRIEQEMEKLLDTFDL
ncbi:hypothetical protein ACFL2K_00045 [Candidatus Margulisiibacteriota bacterium]